MDHKSMQTLDPLTFLLERSGNPDIFGESSNPLFKTLRASSEPGSPALRDRQGGE